jgi:hypothetical protein
MIKKLIFQDVEWKDGVSKNTGKPYNLAILKGSDGLSYSCFDKDFVESFKLGDEVECEVEERQNGKYTNRTLKKPTGATIEADKRHQEVMNALRIMFEKLEAIEKCLPQETATNQTP